MTKRICPSCGLGAYSSDTVTTWICEACNTEMPKNCEVEIERCKPDRLNEIRERAEKATPGPWRTRDGKFDIELHDSHTWGKGLSPFARIETDEWKNADFIAHAREDIPFLLDELTRLRAELDVANKRAAAAAKDLNCAPCCETCVSRNDTSCYLEGPDRKCLNYAWRGEKEAKGK